MASAFDLAMGAVFRDPHVGVDALWRPGGNGAGSTVRVVRIDPEPTFQLSGARVVNDGFALEVIAAEVDGVAEGDTFQIGTAVYRVQAQPVRQADGMVWRLDVLPL